MKFKKSEIITIPVLGRLYKIIDTPEQQLHELFPQLYQVNKNKEMYGFKSFTGVDSIGIFSHQDNKIILNFEIEAHAKFIYSYQSESPMPTTEMNVFLKQYVNDHPNYRFHIKFFDENYFVE